MKIIFIFLITFFFSNITHAESYFSNVWGYNKDCENYFYLNATESIYVDATSEEVYSDKYVKITDDSIYIEYYDYENSSKEYIYFQIVKDGDKFFEKKIGTRIYTKNKIEWINGDYWSQIYKCNNINKIEAFKYRNFGIDQHGIPRTENIFIDNFCIKKKKHKLKFINVRKDSDILIKKYKGDCLKLGNKPKEIYFRYQYKNNIELLTSIIIKVDLLEYDLFHEIKNKLNLKYNNDIDFFKPNESDKTKNFLFYRNIKESYENAKVLLKHSNKIRFNENDLKDFLLDDYFILLQYNNHFFSKKLLENYKNKSDFSIKIDEL